VERPFDQVGRPGSGRVGLGGHDLAASTHATQAVDRHEPFDLAAAHREALAAELVPDLAGPIQAPADLRGGVHPPDLDEQRSVRDLSG